MKEFLIFVFLLIIDFLAFMIFGSINYGKSFEDFYLPAIFLEIAFFGCVILYKINHIDKGGDEDDEDF